MTYAGVGRRGHPCFSFVCRTFPVSAATGKTRSACKIKSAPLTLFLNLLIIMSAYISGCSNQPASTAQFSDSTNVQALHELRSNLRTLTTWDKVHAAEYLIWTDHADGVYEIYKEEETRFGGDSPYRIGVWRVLAQSARSPEERQTYIQKIVKAFEAPEGTDRLHAAETLTKLGVPLLQEAPKATTDVLNGEKNALYMYTLAGAAIGKTEAEQRNFEELVSLTTNPETIDQLQMQGAYALRHIGQLSASAWRSLAQTALAEPEESPARVYLLSAAFVLTPADHGSATAFPNIYSELVKYKASPSKGARSEMAVALGQKGTDESVPVLLSILHNEDPLNTGKLTDHEQIMATAENADVRSAAAYALLKIRTRQLGEL